jgi:adenylate cyclase
MAYVQIVNGPRRGTTFRVADETLIGRQDVAQVIVPDSRASRRHALLKPHGAYFVLLDCGSSNGTMVNGRSLQPHIPQPLYDGDQIAIGDTMLVFRAEGMQPPGQPASRTFLAGRAHAGSEASCRGGSVPVILDREQKRKPTVSATIDMGRDMLGLESSAKASPDTGRVIKRLQAMARVSARLGAAAKSDEAFRRIMDSIFDMFPAADRCFIMLRDPETGDIRPAVARIREADETVHGSITVSSTIVNMVIENRQAALSSDVASDKRFGAQQSIVNLALTSMMCAPLICKDELLGLIGLDTSSPTRAFNADDLSMLTGLAAQAAVAVKNAELFAAVERETRMRAHLSRYLSSDVVEGVLDGTIPVRLGGEKKRGTVLFADIVGFTALADRLPALQVVARLNRYFHVTTDIVRQCEGTLHKFAGDMIMAFWNVLYPDADMEINAIRAGVAMQRAVWEFGLDLIAEGQEPLCVGIGCNTGEFAGGNLGGRDRMEYTVIGDTINLGQRIESLAGRWQVFASESAYQAARDRCCAIGLPPARVKGKADPIRAYSIRGVRIDEMNILLCVPAALLNAYGAKEGRSFLAGAACDAGVETLEFWTTASLSPGHRITFQVHLPELRDPLRVNARVISTDKAQQQGRTVYNRVMLGDIAVHGSYPSLWRPGRLIESDNGWDQMRRR